MIADLEVGTTVRLPKPVVLLLPLVREDSERTLDVLAELKLPPVLISGVALPKEDDADPIRLLGATVLTLPVESAVRNVTVLDAPFRVVVIDPPGLWDTFELDLISEPNDDEIVETTL